MKKRLIDRISWCSYLFIIAGFITLSVQASVPAQDFQNNAQVLQDRFGAFYANLYNPDLNQKSYYRLLLQMYGFYNQFSDDKNTQVLSATVPATIDSALQNGSGSYFLMAFEDTSYPMMLLQKYKSFLIQYVQGKFKQLNENFYASDVAQNFIPFNSEQGQNGELTQLDQSWDKIEQVVNQAFTTAQTISKKNSTNAAAMQQWMEGKQTELKALFAQYQDARNSALVSWFFTLVTTLSNTYNPTAITLKKYSFEKVVNITALQVYEQIFYDALDKFLTGNQDYTLGHYVFKTPQSTQVVADKAAIIFTDVTAFKSAIKNYIALQLGTMNAFLAQLELEKAVQACQGNTVKEPVKQVSPGYSQYVKPTAPASMSVVSSTAAAVKSPFATAAIVQSPGLQALQKDFLMLTADLQALFTSFAFDGKNLIKSTLAPLTVSSALVTTNNLTAQAVQQTLLQNFSTALNNKNTAITTDALIFKSLALASNWYGQVIAYYQKANQPLLLKSYTDYQNYILAILTLFKEASDAYQASLNAVQFTIKGAAEKTQSSYLLDAKNAFNKIAAIFELLHKPDLVLYVKKIGSQAAIKAYQSATQGYVNYYKPWITAYINFTLQVPVLGDINTTPSGFTVDQLQQILDNIFGYLDTVLAPAIADYEQELSFYFGLDQTNPEVQKSIAELQAALQVLQNLEKALAGIYHCAKDEKGNPVCSVSGDIGTIIAACSTVNDNNYQCLGADNYVSSIIDTKNLVKWALFANQKYLDAQQYFENIDLLFKQYAQNLQNYTQINTLFETENKALTYSQFFYLHQARLYVTLAQKLETGKDLQSSQTLSDSAVLYAFARSLYRQGGFNAQADGLSKIIDAINKARKGIGQEIYDKGKTLVASLNDADIPEKFLDISEQAFSYFFTGFAFGNIRPDHASLIFITDAYDKCAPNSDLVKLSTKGFLYYINNHQNDIFCSDIVKALGIYRGYVIKIRNGGFTDAACFLPQAQYFLNNLYTLRDQILKTTLFDPKVVMTQTDYQAKVAAFKKLLSINQILKQAQTQCALYRYILNINAQDLQWKELSENIEQLFGDFYKKTADALLLQEKKNFSSTNFSVVFDSQIFEDIINRYELAASYYSKVGNQKDFIAAKLAVTDTVAFQAYSSLIPVYNFSVDGVSLKSDVNQLLTVTNQQSLDTVLATYLPDTPVYLSRYNEQRIPVKMIPTLFKDYTELVNSSITEQNKIGNTSAAWMLKVVDLFAVPLYREHLQRQAPQDPRLEEYITDYKNQLTKALTTGIVINGKRIFAKMSVKIVQIDRSTVLSSSDNDDSDWVLIMNNIPVPPLPRFSNELNTAYTLYSNLYPLYAKGSDPLSYENKILFPLHDATQQAVAQSAMLNAYLAQALLIWSKIKQLQATDQYKKLVALKQDQRFKDSFGNYSDLYQKFQSLFIDLFGVYGSLLDFITAYGADSARGQIYKLYAQGYSQQIQINSLFFVGDPATSSYKAMAQLSCNYANQVAYYTSSLSQNYNLTSPAIITAIQSLEAAGDLCITQKIDPETTFYPSSNTVYPKPVPGFDALFNFKEAWKFYLIAEQQLVNFLQLDANAGQSFPDVQAKLMVIRAKILKVLTQLGSYYLARFGYNAYQQLLCDLTPDGQKATYTEKVSGILAKDTTKTYAPEKIWKVENVAQIGIDANHPAYLYPAIGNYPQLFLQKDQFGNTIYNSSTAGVTFSLLPQDATSTVFQGVASIQQPSFQTLTKSGQIGSQQVGVADFMAGGTTSLQSDTLGKAYTIMKNDLLNAVYYYAQTIAIANAVLPATTSQSSDVSVSDIIPTQYIAQIFSKAPAFGTTASASQKLPVISVQASESGAVSRFYEIQNFINTSFVQWHSLSFANAQQLYPQTLQYWASQTTFGPDICNQCLKWIDAALAAKTGLLQAQWFSIACSWITNLHYLARNFYWQAYLAGVDYQTAQTDINNIISQLNDKQFIQGQQYIG